MTVALVVGLALLVAIVGVAMAAFTRAGSESAARATGSAPDRREEDEARASVTPRGA